MKNTIRTLKTLIFVTTMMIISNRLEAIDYYWYPPHADSIELSKPGNWIRIDGTTRPTVINPEDALTFNSFTSSSGTAMTAPNYAAELSRNSIQVRYFNARRGSITLKNTLRISIGINYSSPFKLIQGSGGKVEYTSTVDCSFNDYTDLELNSFICPNQSGSQITNRLFIFDSKVSLTTDVTVNQLWSGTNTSNVGSTIKLNGKKLTISSFTPRPNTTAGYQYNRFIGDENAEFILKNSIQGSNLYFSQTTGENVLKAFRIQRTNGSTTIYTDQINNNLIICDELELHSYASLLTEGNLVLRSTSDKTCKVKTPFASASCILGDTLNGSITTQLYIPGGRRVFRYIANPISYNLSLSELTDDIDITGTGGSTNGFTTTTTNNPSSFIFDASLSDGSTTGLDAGWKEFTSATSSSKNWLRHQGVLTYIRGTKGQGLNGVAYSPAAVTLDITGLRLNTSDQTVNLATSANSTWVSVGNPYVHPIEIGNQPSSQRSNVGNNFYVFDANLGSSGGFITQTFGSSYILPPMGGFFTTLTGTSTSGSITFKETDKSDATADNIFADLGSLKRLKLEIYKGDRLYDQTELVLDSSKTLAFDMFDAEKMSNFDLNLFTHSSEGKKLAINYGLFNIGQIIPLGIETAETGEFTFNVPINSFSQEHFKLKLIDIKNRFQTELKNGSQYSFNIDLNDKTSFENRFAIQIDAIQSTAKVNSLAFNVYPNPTSVNNGISVISNESISNVEILDLQGKLVQKTNCNEQKSINIAFEKNLTEGIYIIKVSNKNGLSTQKISIK